MNKKITLYLLSASLVTLSEGYALFGFGKKVDKNDPKAKVSKMVKEGFPSATFGSCTKTDGSVKFDVLINYYNALNQKRPLTQSDNTLLNTYDNEVNKKLDKLKECAKKKNPNFTKALAASCKTHQSIIPKEWTRSQALCKMVSSKQGAVETKNAAITLMKQDYGSSKFACSKGYGKISWSGATEKFKKLSSDGTQADVFAEYRRITDNHLSALSKCAIEKNKNFAAVLHKSCTTDAPIKQWESAVNLCAKAAKIMEGRNNAASAKAQAKIDEKLFPGMTAIRCTKGVAAPFDPAGLADYMKRQADILSKKGVSAKEKEQAMKNGKRVLAYVDRLSKCAVNESDVNFNKVLAEKFAEADKNCKLTSLKQYQKTKVGSLLKKYHMLCKTAKKTSKNIGNSNVVTEAKKALGVPSNRLGWVGFPTKVVAKLGDSDNFSHLTKWFTLDKEGFDKHFGIILKGVSVGKNGKVANPKSVALLAEGCGSGTLAAFAKKKNMASIVEVCKVAGAAGAEHSRQKAIADAFKTLKLPSKLMAPAAYKICNEVMTEIWQEEDGISAIKTILSHEDALPRWQKHVAGIHGCISKNDIKTGVTRNPIMTSYIVASGDELKQLGNANLETLVYDAETIQERKERYLEREAGTEEVDETEDAAAIEEEDDGVEVNVDEDDVANLDDVAEDPENYEEEEGTAAEEDEEGTAAEDDDTFDDTGATEAGDFGELDAPEEKEGGVFEAGDEEEAPAEEDEEGTNFAEEEGGVFEAGDEEETLDEGETIVLKETNTGFRDFRDFNATDKNADFDAPEEPDSDYGDFDATDENKDFAAPIKPGSATEVEKDDEIEWMR